MIYKTFFGKHIDLDRLVAVGDAEFIDRMGFGGWFVGFDMHFQLMDKPIRYERGLISGEEYTFNTDDTTGDRFILVRDAGKIKAVENMQRQIDKMIQDWKAVKSSANL